MKTNSNNQKLGFKLAYSRVLDIDAPNRDSRRFITVSSEGTVVFHDDDPALSFLMSIVSKDGSLGRVYERINQERQQRLQELGVETGCYAVNKPIPPITLDQWCGFNYGVNGSQLPFRGNA